MKVRDLLAHWEAHAAEPLTVREYHVRLPISDAARLTALAELYPQRRLEDLLTDLVTVALDEVEEALPYVQGMRIVSEDDQGDPIYEDAGPAVRFRELARRFAADFSAEAAQSLTPE